MKKVFNLSVILAALMAAFSFTSCSDDDDDAASVSIAVETTPSSAIVSITSDEDLKSVELWQNGSKTKNITVKDGTNKGKAGVNVYTITGLNNGEKYTVKASSETGASEKSFTVGENETPGDANVEPMPVKASTINVGDIIVIKNSDLGEIEVKAASKKAITLIVNGKEVELSDAGASYLTSEGKAAKIADVKNGGVVAIAKVFESQKLATVDSNDVAKEDKTGNKYTFTAVGDFIVK